jgi:hypothetical protein
VPPRLTVFHELKLRRAQTKTAPAGAVRRPGGLTPVRAPAAVTPIAAMAIPAARTPAAMAPPAPMPAAAAPAAAPIAAMPNLLHAVGHLALHGRYTGGYRRGLSREAEERARRDRNCKHILSHKHILWSAILSSAETDIWVNNGEFWCELNTVTLSLGAPRRGHDIALKRCYGRRSQGEERS